MSSSLRAGLPQNNSCVNLNFTPDDSGHCDLY